MKLKQGQKLPNFKLKVKFNLEGKDFEEFINKKFGEIGMKTKEHEHKLVFIKTIFDWKCNECNSQKAKSEPRLYCSICDYNMCNNCRKEKKYYKFGNIPINALPSNNRIKNKFIKHNGHEHRLVYCRTKRTQTPGSKGSWICNICKEEHNNKTWTFYCTCCDYDLCTKCAQNENLI